MPVLGEILYSLFERNAATRAAIHPVHELVDRGTRSKLPQFRTEVLLERFALACSPSSEYGVCLVGEISYEYVRHSCIMIASIPRTGVGSLERDMPDEQRCLGRQTERGVVIEAMLTQLSYMSGGLAGAYSGYSADDVEVRIDGVQVRSRRREFGDRVLARNLDQVGNGRPRGRRQRGLLCYRWFPESAPRQEQCEARC